MGSFFGGGSKKQERQPEPEPVVVQPPPSEDPEKVKRIGRSQLISTSSRGVLGNANTSNKKLSV